MKENQHLEKKSIRLVTGANPEWKELSKDCVCFANELMKDFNFVKEKLFALV